MNEAFSLVEFYAFVFFFHELRLQGLCHTPGILVQLVKKKNVCVWLLISLKLSPCVAISLVYLS